MTKPTPITTAAALSAPPEGKLYSFLDATLIRETPEEHVRQQMLKKLIVEYNVSRDDIEVEKQIKVFSGRPRLDIVVYEHGKAHTAEHIIGVIECKAPNQSEKAREEAKGQMATYVLVLPNVRYAIYTEGGEHADEFFAVKPGHPSKQLVPILEIPQSFALLNSIDIASKEYIAQTQHIATGDSLKRAMTQVHNKISADSGYQKDISFLQMIKILDAKLEDEHLGTHEFIVTQDELDRHRTGNDQDRREVEQEVLKRVNGLLLRAIKAKRVLHDANDLIDLGPRTAAIVMFAVSKFQSIDLSHTSHSVREEAYQEFVGSNLRGDRGEFFTPREVTRHIVQMLDPQPDAIACDPAQGTGGFIQGIIDYVVANIERDMKKRGATTHEIDKARRHYVENFVVGLDLNPRLVESTRTSVVFAGEATAAAPLHFYQNDSLAPFRTWDPKVRAALGIEEKEYSTSNGIVKRWEGSVDYIATNPPFGMNIRKTDPEILREFDIITGGTSESVEALFVERVVQLLKPGTGRAAMITPVGLLSNPDRKALREWLLRETEVLASIELPIETFLPHTGTQTHVLILRRKSFEEVQAAIQSGNSTEYAMMMASVGTVGHDRRGHPIYKRKADGSYDTDLVRVYEDDRDANGEVVQREKLKRVPHRDSQMPDVTAAFKEFESNRKTGALVARDGKVIRL